MSRLRLQGHCSGDESAGRRRGRLVSATRARRDGDTGTDDALLQGQYGIGLLGFWSIGVELEMRSQVAGGEPWALRMWEEKPNFEVAPLRGRLRLEGTWTEVHVWGLHRPALASLTGARSNVRPERRGVPSSLLRSPPSGQQVGGAGRV